jgi:hypothetical protein
MNEGARSFPGKDGIDGAIESPYRLGNKESVTGGFTHADHPLIRTFCDF